MADYKERTIAIRRRNEFMAIKGTAYQIACALNYFTPGVNWCGCTKGELADDWAVGKHDKLGAITIIQIKRQLGDIQEYRI